MDPIWNGVARLQLDGDKGFTPLDYGRSVDERRRRLLLDAIAPEEAGEP